MLSSLTGFGPADSPFFSTIATAPEADSEADVEADVDVGAGVVGLAALEGDPTGAAFRTGLAWASVM